MTKNEVIYTFKDKHIRMNYLILSFLAFFLLTGCLNSDKKKEKYTNTAFESDQIYKGHSKDNGYLCYLKISPDNRVVFTYQTSDNNVYGEHVGTIKAINDSLFRLTCKLTFGQFVCKAFTKDSLKLYVEPAASINKKKIRVRYHNGDWMRAHTPDKFGVAFAFNPDLFNEDYPAFIVTDHIHPITKEPLLIKAIFGSAYQFAYGDKVEFDIVITNDSAYTTGEETLQSGHIQLKKQ